MATLIVNEFAHLSGHIDVDLFSEICSVIITSRYHFSRFRCVPIESWRKLFPRYIAYIIRVSNRPISVAVAALTLVERYQNTARFASECRFKTAESAYVLFLSAYMAATKVMFDQRAPSAFWKKVSGDMYTSESLCRLERGFYQAVDWRVRIDSAAYAMTFGKVIEAYQIHTTLRRQSESPPPSYYTINSLSDTDTKLNPIALLSEREEIPMLDDEDEKLFARALVSPAAQKVQQERPRGRTILGLTLRSFGRS